MKTEEIDTHAGQLMALARNQVLIRATVYEDEDLCNLTRVNERFTRIKACVLGDAENPLVCEIDYQMTEPIEKPLSPNSPSPCYGYDPQNQFRSMIRDWVNQPKFVPFTQNEAVVIYHHQRQRCLALPDPVFLQHIARIQVGLSYYVSEKDQNPHYKPLLDDLFYRLSRFLVAQNRRRREVDGI